MTASTVPFNDLARGNSETRDRLVAALEEVVRSGWYLSGPQTEMFEAEFAEWLGTKHCVAVANGTDGLELALRAVGVRRGDEVITVANAGGYSSVACLQIGARPVYVDVDPNTLLLDPATAIRAVTERTRALVCTHLYGSVVNVPEVRSGLNGSGVALVEDCAQAHGATRDGRKAGTLADVAAFSFYPTKNLGALGDAGAVVTDDPTLAERLRRLHQYGWVDRFDAREPGGRNSRMDELQAAVLRSRLPGLAKANRRRVEIVSAYERALGEALSFPLRPLGHVGHLCVATTKDRDGLRRSLRSRGIDTAVHYPVPDHHQRAFVDAASPPPSLPVTERTCSSIVSLPCFPGLEDAEIEAVCDAVHASIGQVGDAAVARTDGAVETAGCHRSRRRTTGGDDA